MNQEEAAKIAWNYIQSAIPQRTVGITRSGVAETPAQVEVAITQTIEKDYGWIFLWQSRKSIESGKLRDMLIGNCPVLITKDGKMVLLPTSCPVEESLCRYELGLPLLPRRNGTSAEDQ